MRFLVFFIVSVIVFFRAALGLELSELNIKTDNVSGKFNEKMVISGFDNDFVSSGEFEIKNGELLWAIKKPVQNTIKINSHGVFELINGKWVKQRDALFDKDIFLAITKLEFDKLNKDFNITINGSKQNWKITLIPKNKLMKEVFSKITIIGDKFVRKIVINSVNGDETTDEFFEVK